MGHGVFGWDLPPGVSVNDIPGNRPEDEAWEKIILEFYENKLTEEEWNRIEPFAELIDKAIEYGIEVGKRQAERDNQQNRYYETSQIEEILKKANVPKDVIKKVSDILGGKYETP